jgi:tRNA 2-selenouridine synthase
MHFTPDLPVIDDLGVIFSQDISLLDVRAPIEYNAGAVPSAKNYPLLNDQQRHEIGLIYKQQGQPAAIRLGLTLIDATKKQQRIDQWQHYAKQHPEGALYCFRGGLRSKISQQWLYDATGIRYPRIQGGYKAIRHYLLQQLEINAQRMRPIVIAGRTGVGKTLFIQHLSPHLDLEYLAYHRGSAFGQHAKSQPTQVNFENALSIALLKLTQSKQTYFVSEDESRNIGSRHIPTTFYTPFSQAPLIELEANIEQRIAITVQEYVHNTLAEYENLFGPTLGFTAWTDYLKNSLARLQKRLGGVNYKKIRQALEYAIAQHHKDIACHHLWIKPLLLDYYDAMYQYQLDKKQQRIEYRGDQAAVYDYLHTHYAIS